MVAYSFQPVFVAGIVARSKRQTIRAHRKRHARPGEPVQLYQGMRTSACRKIIPDPVCIGHEEVRIDLRGWIVGEEDELREALAGGHVILTVDGTPLTKEAADAYAVGDGFPSMPAFQSRSLLTVDIQRPALSPIAHMAVWWLRMHGDVLFEGVAIRWQDPA